MIIFMATKFRNSHLVPNNMLSAEESVIRGPNYNRGLGAHKNGDKVSSDILKRFKQMRIMVKAL